MIILQAYANKVAEILKTPAAHIEWFFVLISLTFGVIFLIVIPPMQGADESNHFVRAYQISEGNIISDYVGRSSGGISTKLQTYDQSVGGNLPSGIVDFTQAGFGTLPQHPDHKMTPEILEQLRHYKIDSTRKDASFGNTAAYSPAAYAPYVVGIWLGRAVSDRPIVIFYLARIMGLIAGIVLIAVAIRLMPFGKLPFAIFALLPMTVAQLPVVTADTLAVGFCFLAIAATLKFAYRKVDMSRRDVVLLFGIFATLGLVKPSLAPVILVLLALLYNQHIRRRKVWAIILLCGSATALLGIGWNLLVKDAVLFGYQQAYPASNYADQLSYILHQPFIYLQTLAGTFFGHYFDYAVFSFIGILGWADTALPMIAIVAGFINIAFAFYITSQSEKMYVPPRLRWLAGGIFVAVFCVTATFMYLFCNSVKDNYVTGLQGRYLIPVAPLLICIAVIGKQVFSTKKYAIFARRSLYMSVALLGFMVLVAVMRFYVA